MIKYKANPANKEYELDSRLSNSEIDKYLETSFKGTNRGRPASMTIADVMLCLSLKRRYSCNTWIGLYRCLEDKVKLGYLKIKLPHYSNFLIAMKKLIRYLIWLIYYQLDLNRHLFLSKKSGKIAFVDSTPLPVCKIKRSSRHKTMNRAEISDNPPNYSKSTMGWYFGYKLHMTIDYESLSVIDFRFSSSKLDDRQYLADIMTIKEKFLNSNTVNLPFLATTNSL